MAAALKVFQSQLQAAAPNSTDSHLLRGLAELCERKLGIPVSSVGPVSKKHKAAAAAGTAAAHPLVHLTAALRQGDRVSAAAGKGLQRVQGVSGYREQRAADAAAAGHALAFLLHPAVYPQAAAAAVGGGGGGGGAPGAAATEASIHQYLVDEALRVLQSKGKAAFSSTAASPLLAAGGSGGKGSSGEALRARARGSKVLLELLDMTGLEPVKKAMLDLADQVRAACKAR